MSKPMYQVDAFTDRAFGGNPAAVCPLDSVHSDAWMQAVAQEMNLAETAFLLPRAEGYDLRWFTPTVEVDLCGHATIASAHVLWETGRLAPDRPAVFETRSGRLTATREGQWIAMDFPATPPEPIDPPQGLEKALGARCTYFGRSRFDYLVETSDEAAVRGAAPDFGLLRTYPVRGVILTARSDTPDADFVSRFFAPAAGVDEDPATGSSHCCLAPYWGERLGKQAMTGRQLSRRGGAIRVETAGDRVVLRGQAVTMLVGELVGPAAE